ncbi:MAG: hypothetical protein QXX95_05060 [Nitrososphaerales archaeon]
MELKVQARRLGRLIRKAVCSVKAAISSKLELKVQARRLGRLNEIEARREELFSYYRNKSDRSITYIVDKEYHREVKQGNLEDEKRQWSYVPIKHLLPKRFVEIQYRGTLKILAFSDYRVHDIDVLLNFVKSLKEKPDIILYAGDDIRRFAPTPLEFLKVPVSDEKHPKELEAATLLFPDRSKQPSCTDYGFVLRLPKHMNYEGYVQARVSAVLKTTCRLYEALKKGYLQPHKDQVDTLKELLAGEYPSCKVIEGENGRVMIVDESTGTEILEMIKSQHSGRLLPNFLSGYWSLLHVSRSGELLPINYRRVGEDKKYVYYYIAINQPNNVFEELAREARYGLAFVIGNDDGDMARLWIYGEKVYDLHTTWLKIGSFLLVGLEGSTSGTGPSGKYLEGDVKLRLELAQRMLGPKDKLVIVSHTPPKGVLDRAMRFGDEAIGSLALRDFLEECHNVALVICGHVHRCGGKYEMLGEVTVANVSSHDSPFDRANIAWMLLDETGDVEVKMMKLPSPIEQLFRKESKDRWLELLQTKAQLSTTEARLFIEAFEKHNGELFSDLSELASLKFRYHFSWDNIFKLYAHGIKAPEQITDSIYKEVLKQSYKLHKIHLMRAYVKVKRDLEREKIYLINPISLPTDDKLVAFDMEYSTKGVLYGFLDLSSGDLKQFWFDERGRAAKYLDAKKDYLFISLGRGR